MNALLLERTARGDAAAWTEVVERYGPVVQAVAGNSHGLGGTDITDALQNTWRRLARAVAFGRWRAGDVRSILAAGAGTPQPTTAGDALVLELPRVPTRPCPTTPCPPPPEGRREHGPAGPFTRPCRRVAGRCAIRLFVNRRQMYERSDRRGMSSGLRNKCFSLSAPVSGWSPRQGTDRAEDHDPAGARPGRGRDAAPDLHLEHRRARAGRFDVLLVYRVDRLSRSIRGLSEILARLDDAGVAFRSATELFDTATPRRTHDGADAGGVRRVRPRHQRHGTQSRPRPVVRRLPPPRLPLDSATGYPVPDPAEAAVVARVFRLYTRDRVGTAAIAGLLNDAGHRTKTGNPGPPPPCSPCCATGFMSGRLFYRDRWHRAETHHPGLIDEAVFAEAEQVLLARGDDHIHRTGARSTYLLAGLIFCTRCGKRYQGTSARGNRYTYRYYTCFTRLRYGIRTCPAERLPADQVEHAPLDCLLAALAGTDLIDAALADAHDEHAAHTTELAAVETELVKTEAAIDRYLTAFENQMMPEATCAPRIRALSDKATELKARRDELGLLLDDTSTAAPRPSPAHLEAVRDRVRHAAGDALPETVQALLQAMTERIDVTSRANITPTFRVPITDTAEPSTAAVTDGEVRTRLERCPRQCLSSGHHSHCRGTSFTPEDKGWTMGMAQLVVTAVLVEGRSKSEVARTYGVSRRWVITLVAALLNLAGRIEI
jgi:site-specific DNA recombinase